MKPQWTKTLDLTRSHWRDGFKGVRVGKARVRAVDLRDLTVSPAFHRAPQDIAPGKAEETASLTIFNRSHVLHLQSENLLRPWGVVTKDHAVHSRLNVKFPSNLAKLDA